jgi:outer membrane protein assembly factor BamB
VSAVDRSTGANAQTPFRVDTRWAQFRKRASHDGHNFGENVLSPTTVGGLSLLWKYATHNTVDSPAVSNGVVYIGTGDGKVYALNASTGALLWKHTGGGGGFSSPTVSSGVVYFNSAGVYARKASTGTLLWQYATGGPGNESSSPAVANGVVYVGSYAGNVYALDASTGALLWKYPAGYAVLSSPAVANGVVYVGGGFEVLALNAGTGALPLEIHHRLHRRIFAGGVQRGGLLRF